MDEDRRRRLRQLEEKITDPRSVSNVDCLLVSNCFVNNNLATFYKLCLAVCNNSNHQYSTIIIMKCQETYYLYNICVMVIHQLFIFQDTVQALVSDCEHPAVKRMKNVEAFMNRCKYFYLLLFLFL
jgi:hypothetical protein